jgi:Fur family zinc uptake transcriptional regulator
MSASESDRNSTVVAPAMAGPRHAHRSCACEKVPLTPGRRRVLDALHSARRPLGAYELIERVATDTGKRPAPISVYRALDFLLDNGLVHRLASRNAFMACEHGHAAREPVAFLICEACGAVTEVTSEELRSSLDALADAAHFTPQARVIEVAGRCAACRTAGGT